jgi:hypothetical protein
MTPLGKICLAILATASAAFPLLACAADAPADFSPRQFRVNYWLAPTKHIVVQAKVNGQGPFNFILDTGAPHTFISADAARAANVAIVKPPQEGRIASLEILGGGPTFFNFATGIDDPNQFQLRTINSAMPANRKISGFIGCAMIGRYRLDIDYTQPFMIWTELQPRPLRADDTPEIRAAIAADAAKPSPLAAARPGYLGIELDTAIAPFRIIAIHKNSPAELAGIRVGDFLTSIANRELKTPADLAAASSQVTEDATITLRILRGREPLTFTTKAAAGF